MAAKPMSKTKVVSHLAEKTSIPKKTAATFFEELFKLAVKEFKGPAGKFVVPNLGRAVKAHRKARMGRNPQTGEAIKIKAKTVVRLRAAKAFKDAITNYFPRQKITGPKTAPKSNRSASLDPERVTPRRFIVAKSRV